MTSMNMKLEQVAKILGCSVDQVRAQYQSNANSLAKDAEKAERLGKKVRGFTASELRSMQEKSQKMACMVAA